MYFYRQDNTSMNDADQDQVQTSINYVLYDSS